MCTVSIIIPVYNAEKTIKRCLDSVLNQTFKSIEIICVNDGSTDDSLQVLRDYERKDNRIVVVDKENGGSNSARKAGLDVARGEYIGYVDSDDWVEASMYEELYNCMIKNDADIVCSGFIREGNYISEEFDSIEEGKYGNEKKTELLDKIIFNMSKHDLGISGALWSKLFKKRIMKKAQNRVPDSITIAEDKMIVLTYALYCKSVYVVKKAWYHYVINSGSVTQKPNSNYLENVNEVYKYFLSLYEEPGFTEAMRVQAELYITQLLIKGINSRMGFSVKNLMWITSDWSMNLKVDSRVLVLGKGELAKTYIRQINNNNDIILAGAVDDVKGVDDYLYDYILIAYKDKQVSERINEQLLKAGIPQNKIIWDEQKEIFWKFAEEAGLCN